MFPQYFDIHAHVNFAAYDADRDEVIKRALEAGTFMINIGTQFGTSRQAVELSHKYDKGVYAAVGLHPIHASMSNHDEKELGEGGKAFTSKGEDFDLGKYKDLAKDIKTVAIGECGLDYYRLDPETKTKQVENFIKQIHLANDVNKPLMLHIRNGSDMSAYKDAYEILKSEAKVLGNLHFYAGSIEEAKPFLDLGYTFSFTGVITFAREYKEILRYIPIERIMSETDCPYVTPMPYRGKRNEPLFVSYVVDKIAEIKNLPLDLVKKQLVDNTLKFFSIID